MKRETEEWSKIAMEDYGSAKCLFDEGLFRMVCYPSDLGLLHSGEPTKEDAEKALGIAEKMREHIKALKEKKTD